MRVLFGFLIVLAFSYCNSAKNKDNNQAMDDKSRMRDKYDPAIGIRPINITGAEVPKEIPMSGKLQEAWKWTDKKGENILVLTVVPSFDDKKANQYGELGRSAELHGYHIVKTTSDFNKVWEMNDGVLACEFDITNNFIPGSTTITDLDKNGIAEFKIQYLTACRSDVSPSEYKLVLVENGKPHRLRGLSWLPVSPETPFDLTTENANLEKRGNTNIDNEDDFVRTFGRYENEKEFASAPSQFIEFARKEWIKFVKEKIGE